MLFECGFSATYVLPVEDQPEYMGRFFLKRTLHFAMAHRPYPQYTPGIPA
jgi:hypothetical protein